MRKKMVITLLALAVSIFISNGAFAAWTQAKGHSYNQLSYSYYHTTQKFTTLDHDSAGTIIGTKRGVHKADTEEFTSTNVTYYLEYGLKDDLTLVATIPWQWIRSNDVMKYTAESGPSGIGDITLGLRQKISDNIGAGILMSVQADVKIPEAYDYGNPTVYQSLGDGQYDTTLKLVFGKGFAWGYTVFSTGYKYRFENDEFAPATFKPSDEMLVSLNAGYNIAPKFSLRGNIGWKKTVGNAEVSEEMRLMFIPYGGKDSYEDTVIIKDGLGLEQEGVSAGVALAYSISSKTQTVLSYNTDISGLGDDIATKNAGLGETWSLAFVYMH